MMSLVARLLHASGPALEAGSAGEIAAIMERRCFEPLERISAIRGNRQLAFVPKTLQSVSDYLTDNRNAAVILDNGRSGPLEACVRIATGLSVVHTELRRPAQSLSYVVVPLETATTGELLAAMCDLAIALRAVAGAVTTESTFDEAQSYAMAVGGAGSRQSLADDATSQHLRERASYHYYLAELDERIASPEWGLFLGAGHLATLPIAALRNSGAFAVIRELRHGELAYLQLTGDPADALAPGFAETLAQARQSLREVLMDSSIVPERAWQ